jgi:hypothetical protein
MQKPTFQDLAVECWLHRGKIGVAARTLCFFHSSVELGAPILDALRELKEETCSNQRMVSFDPCKRRLAFRKLRLHMVESREELRVMNVRGQGETAAIEMTSVGIDVLADGFTSWLNGAEDFGVSPRDSALHRKELGALDCESWEVWFWGPSYLGP